jgi:hypothetical protein
MKRLAKVALGALLMAGAATAIAQPASARMFVGMGVAPMAYRAAPVCERYSPYFNPYYCGYGPGYVGAPAFGYGFGGSWHDGGFHRGFHEGFRGGEFHGGEHGFRR